MKDKIEAFFAEAKKWRDELALLRRIILDCGLKEEFKWGKPCYTCQEANVVVLLPLKEHCSLLLTKGALLQDPDGILIKAGENTQAARQIRLKSVQEIRDKEAILKSYLQQAIEVEKAGLEVVYKKIEEHAIPEEFQKCLDKSAALKTAFRALTPGRQRGYLMHFAAPKQSKTREARIEKCREQILKGKGLND